MIINIQSIQTHQKFEQIRREWWLRQGDSLTHKEKITHEQEMRLTKVVLRRASNRRGETGQVPRPCVESHCSCSSIVETVIAVAVLVNGGSGSEFLVLDEADDAGFLLFSYVCSHIILFLFGLMQNKSKMICLF
ncbi:hypothetical protein MtrunA17_Chr8g0383791 [Medicago truncatula]|uniref:Transmembrane protein n=1 Tax=Medicago truncatula TaxID=3880 RepID=A0A396GWS8_MEDTR|nr:hypothetical protein MtrunA17_Chr8g0383791 [Medicago truncatula]